VLTSEPARVLGPSLGTLQASAGQLVEGGIADVCVLDPQAEWIVTADALRSQGKHTPFSGYEMAGRVRCTIAAGQIAYEGWDR
jgi:dihydroorotase